MGLFDKFFDKLFKKKIIKPQQDIIQGKIEYTKQMESEIKHKTEQLKMVQHKRGLVSTYKLQVNDDEIKNLKNRYIAFDVETTGLSPINDKIIEVGAVLFENGEIIKRYSSLVNSEVVIPASATAVNNITNEMIQDAPKEDVVYAELVEFLDDVLKEQTVICAHNATFDMKFLSETLMRLGYYGKIHYVDTLSLSRNLIKGLHNYKQDTVATYFELVNFQSHRAVSDAEICGRILWNLLQIKEKVQEKKIKVFEKNKPSDEEMEVCAYIQNCIEKKGGDSKWLGFYKNSSNYVDISYLYSVLKFKCAKKGKYIIVEKEVIGKINLNIEPCTMSEGGTSYIRVYFNSPFELEPLADYFYKLYIHCRKSALDYFKYHKCYEVEYKNSPAMLNQLSDTDVGIILESAKKRKKESDNPHINESTISSSRESQIAIKDIIINPIHDRVPLSDILNKNNFDKGFIDGYSLWKQGDNLRKEGELESAIKLFDLARYNGYDAPVLYTSYAMAFRKLKDYENEIDILNEGIERIRNNSTKVSQFEVRRDKAIQLLHKQKEAEKRKLENEKLKNEKSIVFNNSPVRSNGRAILQLTDEMVLIKRYDTVSQAVRETGVNSKSIRDAAKGVQKHAGGYIWKYADEE